jgi:hypothetical protein
MEDHKSVLVGFSAGQNEPIRDRAKTTSMALERFIFACLGENWKVAPECGGQ